MVHVHVSSGPSRDSLSLIGVKGAGVQTVKGDSCGSTHTVLTATVQRVPLFASPRAWSRSSVQGLGNHAIQTLASLRSLTFFSSASGPSLGACLLIGCKWRRNYNSRRELRAGSCSGSRGLDSRHQKPSPSSSSLQVRFKFASRCLRLK